MSLLERTRALLKKHVEATPESYSLPEIARLSDGTVEYEWLKKFLNDKIADPGVRRVEALHNHLESLPAKRPN